MSHAVLIMGHGSRDAEGVAEFLDMARQFRAFRPDLQVEVAFLEFARPTIAEAIDRLVATGVTTLVALPGVLMAAGHAKNDMASEVRAARERHPGLTIHMGRALDVEPHLLELCKLRYHEALADRPLVDPAETLLLLIGRGSSDPDANANITKIARFLQEGYPTGWAACGYTGVTAPLTSDALKVCERMGFRRIVVQPYFLFTGILLKRIYEQVADRQRARPDLEFVVTPHLQAHRLLFAAFAERAREAVDGVGNMNCSLCQYRVPIIGHETKYGEAQGAHHHHVQGLFDEVHQLDEGRPSLYGLPLTVLPLRAEQDEPAEPHPWTSDLRERLRF